MKRITTICIITIISLTSFMSCSKDNGIGNNEEENPTTKTMATLTVGMDGTNLLAGNSEYFPSSNVTAEERKLYNIVVCVFDERQLLEDYKIQSYTNGIDVTQQQLSFVFDELSTGYHYFYVIANVPKYLFDQESLFNQKGLSIKKFEEQILPISDIKHIIGKDEQARGFMMTNKTGPAVAILQPQTDGQNAPANSVMVRIARAMGKVSFAYLPATNGETFGKLTNVYYKVVNNPNRMYLMPVMTPENVFLTPHFYDAKYDPSHFSSLGADDYLSAILKDTPTEDKTATYCMENNNLTPLQGNTTCLIIRGKFEPSQLLDAQGQATTTPSADGTFWRDAKVVNGEVVSYGTRYFAALPGDGVLANDEIAVAYPEGISYHCIWLKNQDNTYSVKRNNYFKVTVTDITGAGEPGEGNVIDPEKPIDEISNLEITFYIENWDDVDIETEL